MPTSAKGTPPFGQGYELLFLEHFVAAWSPCGIKMDICGHKLWSGQNRAAR